MNNLKTYKQHKGRIEEIKQVSSSLWLLKTRSESYMEINPGQFISILCDNKTFRRPFSVCDYQDGVISILFKKKGDGTRYLSELKTGCVVDFIGAQGNGFKTENKKSLLIGAGVGVAPVNYLKKKLDDKNADNILVAGFLNKSEIPANISCDFISTDDGSEGLQGSVVNYLEKFVNEFQPDCIYACGPEIVLKLIVDCAKKHNIEVQIAMEKVMACGIGVCRGCVIQLNKNGGIVNKTVCKDGPVFDGKEVLWKC